MAVLDLEAGCYEATGDGWRCCHCHRTVQNRTKHTRMHQEREAEAVKELGEMLEP